MELQESKSRLAIEDPRQQSGNIIAESKNICLIPIEEPEAITSALALFYTLNDLGKNVNLIIDSIPENLKFLTPSLDFISYPKNFVISIPNRIANISQISYEKNDESVKIFLTMENGKIKKDDLSFYFSETKPDLVVTLGVKDYSEQLKSKLNSFGFLLDSPILNIDSSVPMPINSASGILDSEAVGTKNKKFGKINLINEPSVAQTVFGLIKSINSSSVKKELAMCLLSGIVIHTQNFKENLTADIFQISSELMRAGADLKKITENIYKSL